VPSQRTQHAFPAQFQFFHSRFGGVTLRSDKIAVIPSYSLARSDARDGRDDREGEDRACRFIAKAGGPGRATRRRRPPSCAAGAAGPAAVARHRRFANTMAFIGLLSCGRSAVAPGILSRNTCFAAGRLQSGKLAGEVLGVGRDAGIAVNHAHIMHRNLHRKGCRISVMVLNSDIH
jgi:hypothetical protein